jgi:Zn-finger nucleic acid-binding protein
MARKKGRDSALGLALERPRCWVPLKAHRIEVFGPDLEMDVCPRCIGIWLDPGELGKLLKDREVTDFLTKEIGVRSRSPLICPACKNLMDLEMAEDVEVDVCLACRGVWLDAGELEGLKRVPEDGFDKDVVAKTEERWEEFVLEQKNSKLKKFAEWLKGRGKDE